MTIDLLITHRGYVKKLLSKEETPLSAITGNNIYPIINKQKGKVPSPLSGDEEIECVDDSRMDGDYEPDDDISTPNK